MLGTLVDAYFRGYDCITLEDGIATTSPTDGLENVLYNATNVRDRFMIPSNLLIRPSPELRIRDRYKESGGSHCEGR